MAPLSRYLPFIKLLPRAQIWGPFLPRTSSLSVLPKFATRGTTCTSCTNCWLFYDVDSSKLYQILSHAFTHSNIYRRADQSEGNILQAILQVVPWWRIMALKLAIAINIASIHLGAQLQMELWPVNKLKFQENKQTNSQSEASLKPAYSQPVSSQPTNSQPVSSQPVASSQPNKEVGNMLCVWVSIYISNNSS